MSKRTYSELIVDNRTAQLLVGSFWQSRWLYPDVVQSPARGKQGEKSVWWVVGIMEDCR